MTSHNSTIKSLISTCKRGCSGILFFCIYFALVMASANTLQDWKSPNPGIVFQDGNGYITARQVSQDSYDKFQVTSDVNQVVDARTPVSFRYRIKTNREILNLSIFLVAENGTRYFVLNNRATPDYWQGDSYVGEDFRDEKYHFIKSSTKIVSIGYEIHTQGQKKLPVVLDFMSIEFKPNTAPIEGGSDFIWPKNGDRSPSNPPFFGWSLEKMKPVPTSVQLSQDSQFSKLGEESWSTSKVTTNYFTPKAILPNGTWYARLAYDYSSTTSYTQPVRFVITDDSRKYIAQELPDKITAQRPYLFMSPELLAKLRVEKDGAKKDWWNAIDTFVKATSYNVQIVEPEGFKNGVWDYNRWNDIGNKAGIAESNIYLSAFHYLLSRDTASAANARRLMLTVAKWDPNGSTGIKSVDHAAQGLLYSMSIGYDWLNDYLSPEDKQVIRDCIIARGRAMNDAMNPLMVDPSNNHPWFCTAALGIAGLGLYNEIPEAKSWVDYSKQLYTGEYISLGGTDGEWHEGIAYWSYTLFFVFQFVDCLDSAAGVNLNNYPWLEKTARYKILAHPPMNYGVPFGDSKAMYPNHFDALIMSRLAKVYQDPLAQWYSKSIVMNSPIGWVPYFMMWSDSELKPANPPAEPVSALWREWGVGVTHSKLGDPDDTLMTMRSGPYVGRRVGHTQADENNFVIYPKGEALLIDSGYYDPSGGVPYGGDHHISWSVQTRAHNLPLVDGMGQALYTAGADGKMVSFLQQGNMAYMEGDASHPDIYQGRLNYFRRHLISLDSDNYLLWDELKAPKASRFDYLLHSNFPMQVDAAGKKLVINGKKNNMDVRFLNLDTLSYTLSSGFPVTPPRKNSWDFPDQYHFAAYPSPVASVDTVPARIFGEPESFANQTSTSLSSMDWLALFSVSSANGVARVTTAPLELEGGIGGKIYVSGEKYYYFLRENGNSDPLTYSAKLPKSGKNPMADLLKSLITLNGEFNGKGVIIGMDTTSRINRLIMLDALSVKALGQDMFSSDVPMTALVELTKTGTKLSVQLDKPAKAELVLDKKPKQVLLDGTPVKEGKIWSYNADSGKFKFSLPEGTHQIVADVKF